MSGRPNTAWMATMLKKHGSPEAVSAVMAKWGRKGGAAPCRKPRGFAADRELARRAGAIGGRISRPTKKEVSGADQS